MTRHLDNLERLFHKLYHRYGPDDPLCQQAQMEFEDSKAAEPVTGLQQDWNVPYRRLIKDQNSEFMRHLQK